MLGLWGVRRQGSVWRDEAVTYDMAHRTLPELWATAAHVDLVHSAYYLLMHGLFLVFGSMDPLLVMRLPSVAAAAVATAGVTVLGRRLVGLRAGVAAGALFAVVPQIQRFAQEGRSYALVTACVVWATYLLIHAIRSRSAWTWSGYAVLMLTAAILHEFAILALVAHAWAVPRDARRHWAVAAFVAVAGVAPLALLSTGQTAQVAWIGMNVGGLVWFLGSGTVAALCARRLLRHRAAGPGTGGDSGEVLLVRVALPLAVLPGAILLLASLVHPLFEDRYVLYSIVGQALLAGAALDRILRGRGRKKAVLVVVALALLAVAAYSPHLRAPDSRRDDATAIAQAVRQLEAPGDGVLYEPGHRRVWSLTRPETFAGLRDLALYKAPDRSGWLYGTEVSASVIRSRMLHERRIVVLRDPAGEPLDDSPGEKVKRDVLSQEFQERVTLLPHGARVSLYTRRDHS
ncbi:glycosyltransferase family 39 protein [Streptomyces sp. NPDC020951]|uniref:glycosyltransferase family 39 protein n=1 Tax=Streptomyces sp. NPDC020951 TaxID=3365104 RepID=UPI0037B73197